MLSFNELIDLKLNRHIYSELYQQNILNVKSDSSYQMLTSPISHFAFPMQTSLIGIEARLENRNLWRKFHKVGTEMIITKGGRRMFPTITLSLIGLENSTNYCILLEMIPIGESRFKFSGANWVSTGGAEPQSPQRIYMHPDSPALGSHWKSHGINFNKIKLTNNTLDNNGHIILASMHKYQPRLHVLNTSDIMQLSWAPQLSFDFPETEFIAVTAYQNDRITKLKIDNNPFAKGFREAGQSRCRRKILLPKKDEELIEDITRTNTFEKSFSDSSSDVSPQETVINTHNFFYGPDLKNTTCRFTKCLYNNFKLKRSQKLLSKYNIECNNLPSNEDHIENFLPNFSDLYSVRKNKASKIIDSVSLTPCERMKEKTDNQNIKYSTSKQKNFSISAILAF